MKVTILGAGTLLPNGIRSSAGHLVEMGDAQVLLDCGSGVLHGFERHGQSWSTLTHVALSHFHTDHFGDLPALLWALTHGVPGGREEGLILLGPKGLKRVVDALAQAHGDFIRDPGFPLDVVELEPKGVWEDPWGRCTLRTHPTIHTDESVGYRVEGPEGVVGYTGDTGPSPELGDFMSGVDLLICECAVADPTELVNHLSPRSAAEIAIRSGASTLLLTHAYPELHLGRLPDLLRSEGYTGHVLAPEDGFSISPQPDRTLDD